MTFDDPLVLIEASTREATGIPGPDLARWIVAAEIVVELRRLGLPDGTELSPLNRSAVAAIRRHLDGPLADDPEGFLERYCAPRRWWNGIRDDRQATG
jgi:hypothetical protein